MIYRHITAYIYAKQENCMQKNAYLKIKTPYLAVSINAKLV